MPNQKKGIIAVDMFSTNLPLQLTSFIGREREIAEIKRLLSVTRLLTLTGSGGCGKTRLALQVAADLLETFNDGVWLVELAPLSDPALVPQTVGLVLQVLGSTTLDDTDAISSYLREKNALLVLDNCEHLVEASAHLADTLLRTCPNTRLLATSREPFNITGETCFRVPSLALPDAQPLPPLKALAQCESIQLFRERAQAAKPDFQLTNGNASAITQICARLDGMPLAIELAAARVRTLGIEQIAARLDDRFRLLTGGSRTALPRQQTLRATIDWSHDLLSEPERMLFRRLSVFAGGWMLEAAEVVCAGDGGEAGDVLDLLSRLIDKSLVIVEEQESGVRYRFLETIRQYAREKLVEARETEQWQTRHLDFYLRLAEQAEPRLRSGEQFQWLTRLEWEHDNLRVALAWALEEKKFEAGLQLASALAQFWYLRGYLMEGSEWLRRMLTEANDASPWIRAKAFCVAGILAHSRRELEQARALGEQSLMLFRQLADQRGIADAQSVLGVTAHKVGDPAQAIDLLEDSLRRYREMGLQWDVASTLLWLADTWLRQADHGRAADLWAESLALFREMADDWGIAFALGGLGDVARQQGQFDRAIELFIESLALHRKLDHKLDIPYLLEALAFVAVALRRARQAACLLGAAEQCRQVTGSPLPTSYQADYASMLAEARSQISESEFVQAWTEGRALTIDQAIAEANKLTIKPLPPPAPLDLSAGLTAREVEVLRLLANGLSNQQIADQLVLSKRTVHAHLRSIYSKLNVTTRGAATRAAMEQKLT